jgi:hypothetical protein
MQRRGVQIPSVELRARVKELVDAMGIVRAQRLLRVSRESIAKVVAGFELRHGTIDLVAMRLGEADSATAGTPPHAADEEHNAAG